MGVVSAVEIVGLWVLIFEMQVLSLSLILSIIYI